jgi:hypothetical protein
MARHNFLYPPDVHSIFDALKYGDNTVFPHFVVFVYGSMKEPQQCKAKIESIGSDINRLGFGSFEFSGHIFDCAAMGCHEKEKSIIKGVVNTVMGCGWIEIDDRGGNECSGLTDDNS